MHGVDYYELLGVDQTASSAEIKSAYRSLARSMHPDVGGTTGTFRLLREAYETLNDSARRAEYDRTRTEPSDGPAESSPTRRGGGRWRDFGEDPDFVPRAPEVAVDDIPWWESVDANARVRYLPTIGPERGPMLTLLGGWVLLLTAGAAAELTSVVLVLWLTTVVAMGTVVLMMIRRHLDARRIEGLFVAEFGERVAYGIPGAGPDELAQQLTADLLDQYFTRLPAVRVFHGLAWPDSVFADVDHAVLCGRRLVLVESKRWLPGHYTVGEQGDLYRNGHRFRGGATRLPEGVKAFQALLPELEVRGALLVYPSRAGEVTTSEPAELPVTPHQFVREIGAWLAAEPDSVDREAFRQLRAQVVSE